MPDQAIMESSTHQTGRGSKMKFYRWLGWDQVEIDVLTYRTGSPDCLTGSPDNWAEGSDDLIEYEIRDIDGHIVTERYSRSAVEVAIHEHMDRFYSK